MAGIWTRLKDAWRRFRGAPDDDDTQDITETIEPPRPRGRYEPPPLETPLIVPAAGDVFDFHVFLHLSWRDPEDKGELTYERLEELAKIYQDTTVNAMLKTIWRLARDLEPLHPARAEEFMNNHPDLRRGLCFGEEPDKVRCVPTVRVIIDPRLREEKAPLELRRIKLEEEHSIGKMHDGFVRERTEEWLHGFQALEGFATLGKDERQFLLPFAASLVDDQLSKVTLALAHKRYVRYNELVDVLTTASKDHERLGLFEFADAYDKALRTFCRQMGIDIGQWTLADFGGGEVDPYDSRQVSA